MLLSIIIAFLLSLIMLTIVIANYSWFIKHSNLYGHILLFFMGWKVLAYYLATPMLDFLGDFKYWKLYKIAHFEYVFLYIIELVSMFIFLLTVRIILQSKKKYKQVKIQENLLIKLVLLVTIYTNCLSFLESFSFGLISNQFEFFKSLSGFFGQPLTLVLLYNYRKMDRFLKGLIIVSLFTSFLMMNSRGFIIYSILTLLSFFLYYNNWKLKPKHVSYLLITSFLYIVFIGSFPQLSLNVDKSDTSSRGSVSFIGYDNASKTSGRTLFEEVDFRFGMMPRMSSKFVHLYFNGESAGINPILNSAVGILPRSIWPNKPHPSTSDGNDIYSQGMYKIYSESVYGPSTNMVEFSSGGHMFWELGIIGVLFFPIISAIFICFVMNFFSAKTNYIGIAMLISSFKPWGFMEPKIWLSDIPIQIYQVWLPLLTLYIAARFIGFFKILK